MQIWYKVHLCTIYSISKFEFILSTLALVIYKKPIIDHITKARVNEIYSNFDIL
jgi:hypothetical protein